MLIRDLFVVLHINTGLRTQHVLTFGLDFPWAKYSSAQRIVARYQDVIAGLNRVPGVQGAAAVETLPMTGGLTGGSFQIEDRPKAADWVDTLVQYNFVTPGYFRIMGIPLLQGRDFDQRDTGTAMPVGIINDTLARQFFPDDNPIGHRFRDDYDGSWRTRGFCRFCTVARRYRNLRHRSPFGESAHTRDERAHGPGSRTQRHFQTRFCGVAPC